MSFSGSQKSFGGRTPGAPGSGTEYTRLFVLGAPGATADEIRDAFGKYGEICDVHIVNKKGEKSNTGICYVTFSKASEAALAIEGMHGHCLLNSPKPLKVVLANSRDEGCVRDPREHEKMMRLFIMIPKTFQEEDIKEEFEKYGDIDYVRVIRDRETKASKGLGYVKYHRAYHAAIALETCDPQFKPVFASHDKPPQRRSDNLRDGGRGSGGSYYESSQRSRDPYDKYGDSYNRGGERDYNGGGSSRSYSTSGPLGPQDFLRSYPSMGNDQVYLEAWIFSAVTDEQVNKLFDLIPGMEYCGYEPSTGCAYVKYREASYASYAKDKLNGFEYPPGYKMTVRFANNTNDGNLRGKYLPTGGDSGENIHTLIQTIEKATVLLQKAGVPVPGGSLGGGSWHGFGGHDDDAHYSNVKLPPRQPLAPADSPVVERLFIVSSPDAFSDSMLEDCFCRFGDMISAFFMPGRKYGYVKYASAAPAHAAVELLHLQTVYGNRIKVILADPPNKDGEGGRGEKRGAGDELDPACRDGKQRRF